jgi:hypothetical protein
MRKSGLRSALVLVFLLVGAGIAIAQTSSLLDDFLKEKNASFGKAVYFALAAAGQIRESDSVAVAVEALQAKAWGISARAVDEPIPLGDYAHILMQAFSLPSGFMYALIPGGRYAVRELSYLGILVGTVSPVQLLSGQEALSILGRVLGYVEGRAS